MARVRQNVFTLTGDVFQDCILEEYGGYITTVFRSVYEATSYLTDESVIEKASRNVMTTYIPYYKRSASDDFAKDKLGKFQAMKPLKTKHYACTDIGNSNLFADYYESIARFVPERKMWFIYNGQAKESDTRICR